MLAAVVTGLAAGCTIVVVLGTVDLLLTGHRLGSLTQALRRTR